MQGKTAAGQRAVASATIDGDPVPVRDGGGSFAVHPGRHRIDVKTMWPWPHGSASIEVDVPPDQAVGVFYAAPLHGLCRTGNIGLVPQSRPGMASTVGLVMFSVVVGLLLGILVIALLA